MLSQWQSLTKPITSTQLLSNSHSPVFPQNYKVQRKANLPAKAGFFINQKLLMIINK